jgi:hypothetical protein
VRSGIAAMCVIALAAIPASAVASTKSQSTTLTTIGQTVTLTPKCPSGQHATGGGFRSSHGADLMGPEPFLVVTESRKVGQRRWRVSGEQAGNGTLTVTAFAYCDANGPRTTAKSTTVAAPPGTITTADARCGSGEKAQAGGFSSSLDTATGSATFFLDSFRLNKKTWRVRGTGSAPPPPAMTSYVYCAPEKAPKASTGTVTGTGFNSTTATSPKCKSGTHALAGGFMQPDLLPTFAAPTESARSGGRWRATMFHTGSTTERLNAIAYCS